jgi:hypothetical protein
MCGRISEGSYAHYTPRVAILRLVFAKSYAPLWLWGDLFIMHGAGCFNGEVKEERPAGECGCNINE